MNSVYYLKNSLDLICWRDEKSAHESVRATLSTLVDDKSRFWNDLEHFVATKKASLESHSVERPTHFKWLVIRRPESQYKVWLHVYKPQSLRGNGFAVVPHNHRYPFTSLILTGGFTNVEYHIHTRDEVAFWKYAIAKKRRIQTGQVYTLGSEVIHSLTEIAEPTATLVVQSAPNRLFS